MKVKMYKPQTKKLSNIQIVAVMQTAEQLRAELIDAQYLPFDEGTLQNVQTSVDVAEAKQGEIKIVNDTPYARRLYYNPDYNFQTTNNPNARGLWWDDWLTGPKKGRAATLFSAFMKKLSGGIIK